MENQTIHVTDLPISQGRQGGGPADTVMYGGLKPRARTYNEQLVIFVADNSGSMSGEKAQEASQAIRTCQQELASPLNKDGFRTSVIVYGSSSRVAHSAQPPESAGIELDGSGGGTTLAPALDLALAEIRSYKARPDRMLKPAMVIVFSDGQLDDGKAAEASAQKIKNMEATIVSIGFGQDADAEQLRRLATSRAHFTQADVSQLKGIFASVGKTLSAQI